VKPGIDLHQAAAALLLVLTQLVGLGPDAFARSSGPPEFRLVQCGAIVRQALDASHFRISQKELAKGGVPRQLHEIEDFKLATLNVGGDIPMQEQFEQALAVLGDIDADIAVLTEVGSKRDLRGGIEKILGDRWEMIMLRSNDQHSDIAFLVKRDLPVDLEVFSNRREKWHNPATNHRHELLFSRDLPILVVRPAGVEEPLLAVAGVHNRAMRDIKVGRGPTAQVIDPKGTLKRTAEIKAQGKILQGLRRRYGTHLPVISIGDYNQDLLASSSEFDGIKKITMRSTFDLLDHPPPADMRITHVVPLEKETKQGQLDGAFMYYSDQDLLVDSWIHRFKDELGNPKPLPTTLKQRAENPTDHFPFVMKLNFKKILDRMKSP
jgi:hypothetical protein